MANATNPVTWLGAPLYVTAPLGVAQALDRRSRVDTAIQFRNALAIDPYVFTDDDGQHYLYFGSGGLRVAKLNADMVSFAGAPADVSPSGTSVTVEGSAVFKRNG